MMVKVRVLWDLVLNRDRFYHLLRVRRVLTHRFWESVRVTPVIVFTGYFRRDECGYART